MCRLKLLAAVSVKIRCLFSLDRYHCKAFSGVQFPKLGVLLFQGDKLDDTNKHAQTANHDVYGRF